MELIVRFKELYELLCLSLHALWLWRCHNGEAPWGRGVPHMGMGDPFSRQNLTFPECVKTLSIQLCCLTFKLIQLGLLQKLFNFMGLGPHTVAPLRDSVGRNQTVLFPTEFICLPTSRYFSRHLSVCSFCCFGLQLQCIFISNQTKLSR